MSFQRPRIYTQLRLANNAKTNHIMVSLLIWSAKDRWKYPKSCFKKNARTCSKNLTTQGNIRIWRLKKRLQNLYEKNLNQKLNQLLKIYKMNFTSWKTNKQKVQNFVLPSDESLRAKSAFKLFSKYLKERICEIKQDLNLYWW